jgi:hypothetical protein
VSKATERELMNIEVLTKHVESIIMSLMMREPKFTGSLTLQLNFFDGKPKDIVKEIERKREKIEP